MARRFTKNASNYMSLGINQVAARLNNAVAISVSCWFYPLSLTASDNANRLFNIPRADAQTGLTICTNAAGNLRCGARSSAIDSFVVTDSSNLILLNEWNHAGMRVRFNDPTNDYMFVSLNGISAGGSTGGFSADFWTNGIHTNEPEAIGGFFPATGPPPATANQLDGLLSRLLIWTNDIGPLMMKSLSSPTRKFNPLSISPNLIDYFPLSGTFSPENDIMSTIKGTITGSVPPSEESYLSRRRKL